MAAPLSDSLSPSAHTVGGSGRGAATETVGGGQAAVGVGVTIPADVFEAWLVSLSPAQLRVVLAAAVTALDLTSLPAAFQARALDLAPEAAQLDATAELDAYAAGVLLPFVRLADGSLYYSAGGEQYRLVPDAATVDSLGLSLSAAAPADTLPLPQAPPWPHGTTPAAAFKAAGAIIAARGSTGSAYRFAAMWRGRVA